MPDVTNAREAIRIASMRCRARIDANPVRQPTIEQTGSYGSLPAMIHSGPQCRYRLHRSVPMHSLQRTNSHQLDPSRSFLILLDTPRYSSIRTDTHARQFSPIVAQGDRSNPESSGTDQSRTGVSGAVAPSTALRVLTKLPTRLGGVSVWNLMWEKPTGPQRASSASPIPPCRGCGVPYSKANSEDSEDWGAHRCPRRPTAPPTCNPTSSRQRSASRPGPCAGGAGMAWGPHSSSEVALFGTKAKMSTRGPVRASAPSPDQVAPEMHVRRLSPARENHRTCRTQARGEGFSGNASRVPDVITGGPVPPRVNAGPPQRARSSRLGVSITRTSAGVR